MPIDAVWIVVSVPTKEHEKSLIAIKEKKSKRIHYEDSNRNELSLETPLESILEQCLQNLGLEDVVWEKSKNEKFFQVYFQLDLYENDATLTYLQSKGIGVKSHSSVGYIPFGLFYADEESDEDNVQTDEATETPLYRASLPSSETGHKLDMSPDKKGHMSAFKRMQEDFLKSVTSRLTVAQVVQGVRSSSEMTFDFVMYAIFAGCIAAAGLLNNSPVDVAAAMMIEPVMATVIAITFGLQIRDRELTWIGINSCFISLIICLIVGFIYGGVAFFWMEEWNPPPAGVWPTPEMQVRGLWRTLWYGALQALAAGGAISVTLLNDNQAALVGVAVASTFLPPFINTGLLWAYATHIQCRGLLQDAILQNSTGPLAASFRLPPAWAPAPGYMPVYYNDMRWEMMALSGVSMLYTFVNVICMIAMGVLLLWAKEVVPLGALEPNKRFFKEDIKVMRDYNRRMTMAPGTVAEEQMGNQILSEWAEIAGLDPKTLLSDSPEAKVTQLQTLQDILSDVEADDTYLSVTRNAIGKPNDQMLRRMTLQNIWGNAEGSRRKSSVFQAGPREPVAIFDVESTVASQKRGQRRYTISNNKAAGRRGSKWLPAASATENVPSPSPNLTVGSDGSVTRFNFDEAATGVRTGLRPQEMEQRTASGGRRRSSVLLQRSLKEADHSPFSVWPSSGGGGPGQNRVRGLDAVTGRFNVRRRSSAAITANSNHARRMSRLANQNLPKLSTHSEAEHDL